MYNEFEHEKQLKLFYFSIFIRIDRHKTLNSHNFAININIVNEINKIISKYINWFIIIQ